MQAKEELNIINLQAECNGWKQSLEFMLDGIILLKIRLSSILRKDFNIDLLPQVEIFHTRLLKKEEFINILRHNVEDLNHLLGDKQQETPSPQIDFMRSLVQYQLMTIEIRFNKLRSELDDFFSRKA